MPTRPLPAAGPLVPDARYLGPIPPNTLPALGVPIPPPPLILAFWKPGGDEARIATPAVERDAPWWLYLHLRDRLLYPELAAALADDPRGVHALGSSDEPATVVLVFDAPHNAVWVADRAAAERVLHPPPPPDHDPVDFTPKELRALAQAALAHLPAPVPALGPISFCQSCTNSRWLPTPTGFTPCSACGPTPL